MNWKIPIAPEAWSKQPAPWLEEGTVLSASKGYTTEGQARNHIGYNFRSAPQISLTVKIKK